MHATGLLLIKMRILICVASFRSMFTFSKWCHIVHVEHQLLHASNLWKSDYVLAERSGDGFW